MPGAGRPFQPGPAHWNWQGEKVGKPGLHKRLYKALGQPNKCDHCGTTEAKRFDWANKSQEYKTDLGDWLRLCVKCHMNYDAANYVGKRFAGRTHSEESKRKISESLKKGRYAK